jgi:hypothetical protein
MADLMAGVITVEVLTPVRLAGIIIESGVGDRKWIE